METSTNNGETLNASANVEESARAESGSETEITYPPRSANNNFTIADTLANYSTAENASEYLDGGIGWLITVSAFVLLFLFLGVLYAWGVIQAELGSKGLGTSLALSTIGATSVFFQAAGCLPSAEILSRFGPRLTALVGIIGVGASLILCGFSTANLAGLAVLQGLCFGTFGSMVYITAYTIPSQFFLRKRGLATGVASCGAGIGGAVWSVAIQRLISKWGLPWAYRFVGLISLIIGIVCYIPAALSLHPGVSHRNSNERTLTREKGMFRSSRYIRVLISCFIASYPFFIPPYYISQYAQSVGLSSSQGALYTALFNVSSGFGRVAFGFLADAALGSITAWLSSLLVIALSTLSIWTSASGEALIILFVLICGAGSGGFFSLQNSVVAQIIGSHRVHRGIGWIEVAGSLGFFAGPISAGALLDAFGGTGMGAAPYRPAMFLVGGTTLVASLLIASVRFSTSRVLWQKV